MPVEMTKNYERHRLMNPKLCAPESFRTKPLIGAKRGTKLVVCCPRGKYSRGRCRAGMRAQSILYPKR